MLQTLQIVRVSARLRETVWPRRRTVSAAGDDVATSAADGSSAAGGAVSGRVAAQNRKGPDGLRGREEERAAASSRLHGRRGREEERAVASSRLHDLYRSINAERLRLDAISLSRSMRSGCDSTRHLSVLKCGLHLEPSSPCCVPRRGRGRGGGAEREETTSGHL